jgi:hypothetical protein
MVGDSGADRDNSICTSTEFLLSRTLLMATHCSGANVRVAFVLLALSRYGVQDMYVQAGGKEFILYPQCTPARYVIMSNNVVWHIPNRGFCADVYKLYAAVAG